MLDTEKVSKVWCSPAMVKKMIATGSEDASVRLWDAETGRFLPTLHGHLWGIEAVAFSPDAKTVVGGDSSTILFWN